jgi:hypothetical protein
MALAIGVPWAYWVGGNDAKVERDIIRLQAQAICDGPAWVDVANDQRILCATGSMRELMKPKGKR